MTEKHLAWTVREGRKCLFHSTIPGMRVEGYLAGMDRFNYVVVKVDALPAPPQIRKYYLHKGSTPVIELSELSTYADEPEEIRAELELVIAPFREWVMRTYFANASRRHERPSDEQHR